MRDVVVLAIIAVFLLLCLAYVQWCDNIIGPDPDDVRDDDVDEVAKPVATPVASDDGAMGVDAEAVGS